MNKKASRKDEWRISDMASHLPPEYVEGIPPAGGGSRLSADNIRRLAVEKRRQYLCKTKENEEKPMKKSLVRVLLAAALICVMGVAVFAATGGLGYIRHIFGDSARSIENAIVTPRATASGDGREMAVEALVTDGYITNMVVSLTGPAPAAEQLFRITGDIQLESYGYWPIEALSSRDKTYYALDFTTRSRFDAAEVTLSLHGDIAAIELSLQLDNRLGNAVVSFPGDAVSNGVQLRELQISPMGFLLVGAEEDARGGLPSTDILLVFADGSTEDLEVEFDDGDGTVSGGGGAVMVDEWTPAPLVTTFHGARNPDGEIVIAGQFSRIIDPETIEKVVIQGREYGVR